MRLKFLGWLFAGSGLIGSAVAQEPGTPAIVPLPQKMQMGAGRFTIDAHTQIYASNPSAQATADDFLAWLRRDQKLDLPTRIGAPSAAQTNVIWFEALNAKNPSAQEDYRLEVSPARVHIRGTATGVFYGMQTLMQLLPVASTAGVSIPSVTVDDHPRFGYRGLHLDVGRHLFPVAFIEKYLDAMARYKFNTLHWHLTEDQGWRIEIKKYPRLTQIGAQRRETVLGNHIDPYVGDGLPYGGYYTQDEVREIVAYARARHINVIPEIEMPGHSLAALAAYPNLACTAGPFQVGTNWGVEKDIYCPNEETFAFLRDVLDEVVALFPGTYVHIGGDEAPKDRWKESAVAQAVMRREHLKDEAQLQSYFIQRIEKYVNHKGRRIIGWDEILEGGLAKNATVMSWRGEQGGIAAARQGHDVVMSPGDWCYLDRGQGPAESEIYGRGGDLTLEKVYSYDPLPAALSARAGKHILGVQGNVWSEHLENAAMVEYAVFPRALALAEVAWSPQASRNFADFERRLAAQYARLDSAGVRYRIGPPRGLADAVLVDQEKYRLTLEPPLPGSAIYYTLDGSRPDSAYAARYSAPLDLQIPSEQKRVVRALVVAADGRQSGVYNALLWNRQLKPATVSQSVLPGMRSVRYEGLFHNAADLEGAKDPSHQGQTQSFDMQAYSGQENFGLVFDGDLTVPDDGLYRFAMEADDGGALSIDGESVLTDVTWSKPATAQVPLQHGTHHVRIDYFQREGDLNLHVQWAAPGRALVNLDASQMRH